MPDLLRLPLRAADLALAPTRYVVRTVWGLLYPRDDHDAAAAPAETEASAEAPPRPEPPQTRPRRAPARPEPASPKAARRAVRREPTRGQAAEIRQRQRMEEQDAGSEGGPGAAVSVAEPWEGYAAMSEDQVLDRLTGAEPAVRAAVRLYETFNEQRSQVLYATEETVAT